MDPLGVIILVVAGVLFVIVEMFIPGGIVGVIGLALIGAGVVGGFFLSPTLGLGLLVGALAFGVVMLWVWVKFLSNSAYGRKIIHQSNAGTWHGFDGLQSDLAGQEGVTKTPLHPGGIATIDGRRVDVVTRGEQIAAGTPIKVIKVEGNRVVVTEDEINPGREEDVTGE